MAEEGPNRSARRKHPPRGRMLRKKKVSPDAAAPNRKSVPVFKGKPAKKKESKEWFIELGK